MKYNVILVSFDTLRRDFLHIYGHPKPVSPNLDKLAEGGVLFENTIANSGWTLPQHISLLTGVEPLKHGVMYIGTPCKIPEKIKTISEIFQSNGYLTFGIANTNGYGGAWGYGFNRGMRFYTDMFPGNNMMESAYKLIFDCIEFARKNPFFMYIHVNDTHEPFDPSEPFCSKWGSSYQNKYEGQISYVDHYFGLIIKKLKELKIFERTLVVATSDHGTEFEEHGFLEKKLNLYSEILNVPLIFSLPAMLPARKRLSGLVRTIDIPPTILEICGLPIPKNMDGKSLLPGILGKGKYASDFVFSHTLHEKLYNYEHFSVTTSRYKFIRAKRLKGKFEKWAKIDAKIDKRFDRLRRVAKFENGWLKELYDLENDPKETKNIFDQKIDIARKLERKLEGWLKGFGEHT